MRKHQERYPSRDEGYYYVSSLHLYRLARSKLDRCEMAALQVELASCRSWCEMAAAIARRLTNCGIDKDTIMKAYRGY